MTTRPSKFSCSDHSSAEADNREGRKTPFIKPKLTCYGAVVDLTRQFGGSLTPDEREAQGLDS